LEMVAVTAFESRAWARPSSSLMQASRSSRQRCLTSSTSVPDFSTRRGAYPAATREETPTRTEERERRAE